MQIYKNTVRNQVLKRTTQDHLKWQSRKFLSNVIPICTKWCHQAPSRRSTLSCTAISPASHAPYPPAHLLRMDSGFGLRGTLWFWHLKHLRHTIFLLSLRETTTPMRYLSATQLTSNARPAPDACGACKTKDKHSPELPNVSTTASLAGTTQWACSIAPLTLRVTPTEETHAEIPPKTYQIPISRSLTLPARPPPRRAT